MAVRGFQPLYNLAFFERSLLPLPPPKTLLPEMVLLAASFLLLRAKGEGETHVVSMFDRFSFAGFSFLQGRWHWSLADNDLSSLVLEIKLPLSLSFLYKYSSVIWSEARDNVWWERRRNSIHRWTRAWIGINFPESERVSIRKAPYGRSLLIPVKFNGVERLRSDWLNYRTSHAVTEPIRIRRVQTAIRGHVYVKERGFLLKPFRERERERTIRTGVDLR